MSNPGDDLIVSAIHHDNIPNSRNYTADDLKNRLHTELVAEYNITNPQIVAALDNYIDAQIVQANVVDTETKESWRSKAKRVAAGLATATVGPVVGAAARIGLAGASAANPLLAAAVAGVAGGLSASARNLIELKLATRKGSEGITKYYAKKLDIDRKFQTQESKHRSKLKRAFATYSNLGKNWALEGALGLDEREDDVLERLDAAGIVFTDRWIIDNAGKANVLPSLDALQELDLKDLMTEITVVREFYVALLSRSDLNKYGKDAQILEAIATLSNLVLIIGGILIGRTPTSNPFENASLEAKREIESMMTGGSITRSVLRTGASQAVKSAATAVVSYGITGIIKGVTNYFPGRGVPSPGAVVNQHAEQVINTHGSDVDKTAADLIHVRDQIHAIENGAGSVVQNNNFDANQIIPNDPLVGLARYAAKVTNHALTDSQLAGMTHAQLEGVILPYAQMAGARMENFEVLNLLARNPDLRTQFTSAANAWLTSHPGSGLSTDDVILGMRGRLETFFDTNNPVNATTLAKYFNSQAGGISVASMRQGLNVMTVGGNNGGVNENWVSALRNTLNMTNTTTVTGGVNPAVLQGLYDQEALLAIHLGDLGKVMKTAEFQGELGAHINNLIITGALDPNFTVGQFLADFARMANGTEAVTEAVALIIASLPGAFDNKLTKERDINITPTNVPLQGLGNNNNNVNGNNGGGGQLGNQNQLHNNQNNRINNQNLGAINNVLGTNYDVMGFTPFLAQAILFPLNNRRLNVIRNLHYANPRQFNINGANIEANRVLLLDEGLELVNDVYAWEIGGVIYFRDNGRNYILRQRSGTNFAEELQDDEDIRLNNTDVILEFTDEGDVDIRPFFQDDSDSFRLDNSLEIDQKDIERHFEIKEPNLRNPDLLSLNRDIYILNYPIPSRYLTQPDNIEVDRYAIYDKKGKEKSNVKVHHVTLEGIEYYLFITSQPEDHRIWEIDSNGKFVEASHELDLQTPDGKYNRTYELSVNGDEIEIRIHRYLQEIFFEADTPTMKWEDYEYYLPESESARVYNKPGSALHASLIFDKDGNELKDSFSINTDGEKLVVINGKLYKIENGKPVLADKNEVVVTIDGKLSTLRLEGNDLEVLENENIQISLPKLERKNQLETRVTVRNSLDRLNVLETRLNNTKIKVESIRDNAISLEDFPLINLDEKALLLGKESLWFDRLAFLNPNIFREDYDRDFDFGFSDNGKKVTQAILELQMFKGVLPNELDIIDFINNPQQIDLDELEIQLYKNGWKGKTSDHPESLKKENKEAITKYLFHLVHHIELQLGGDNEVIRLFNEVGANDVGINIQDRGDDQAIQFVNAENFKRQSPQTQGFVSGRISNLYNVASELNNKIDPNNPESLHFDFSKDGTRILKAILRVTGQPDGESISLYKLLDAIENINLYNLYPTLLFLGWKDDPTGANRAAIGLMLWHLADAIDNQINGVEEIVPAQKDETVEKGKEGIVRLIASIKQEEIKTDVVERTKNDKDKIEVAMFTVIGYHGDHNDDLVAAVIIGRIQDNNLAELVVEITDAINIAPEDRASVEKGIYDFISERVLTDDIHIAEQNGQVINTTKEKRVDTIIIDQDEVNRVRALVESLRNDRLPESPNIPEEPDESVVERNENSLEVNRTMNVNIIIEQGRTYFREIAVIREGAQLGNLTIEFVDDVTDIISIRFNENNLTSDNEYIIYPNMDLGSGLVPQIVIPGSTCRIEIFINNINLVNAMEFQDIDLSITAIDNESSGETVLSGGRRSLDYLNSQPVFQDEGLNLDSSDIPNFLNSRKTRESRKVEIAPANAVEILNNASSEDEFNNILGSLLSREYTPEQAYRLMIDLLRQINIKDTIINRYGHVAIGYSEEVRALTELKMTMNSPIYRLFNVLSKSLNFPDTERKHWILHNFISIAQSTQVPSNQLILSKEQWLLWVTLIQKLLEKNARDITLLSNYIKFFFQGYISGSDYTKLFEVILQSEYIEDFLKLFGKNGLGWIDANIKDDLEKLAGSNESST